MEEQNASTQPTPQDFFEAIRKQAQAEPKKGRELTTEEERKMLDGFAVAEMTKSAGWQVVAEILSQMPKAHVSPIGMSHDEWAFAELNAFHQGNVAAELLSGLQQLVSEAHELQKIKLGEATDVQRMKI